MTDQTAPQTTPALTGAGEMFLLACATMGGMPLRGNGRGANMMVARLRDAGLLVERGDLFICTDAGRTALGAAGYDLVGVDL